MSLNFQNLNNFNKRMTLFVTLIRHKPFKCSRNPSTCLWTGGSKPAYPVGAHGKHEDTKGGIACRIVGRGALPPGPPFFKKKEVWHEDKDHKGTGK